MITEQNRPLKVVKFGGSSLADAAQFRKVAAIVREEESRRYVVPSAPGKRFSGDTKVTDLLYACHAKAAKGEDFEAQFTEIRSRYDAIINELSIDISLDADFERIHRAFLNGAGSDYAASRGEYLCGKVLSVYLGYDFIDAEDVIFFTENGQLDNEKTNRVLSETLTRHERAVIPGFYGAAVNGKVKTFSRGGSDITGSVVARAAEADIYENWTDVSGFLMADPRIVEGARSIDFITYTELRELSYMGATVLHEDAIFPVREVGIPINIRNTNRPADRGTMIVLEAAEQHNGEHGITGIAGKKGFSVIDVHKDMMNAEVGFGRRVLGVLERFGVPFEHLPSGIDSMGVVVHTAYIANCREELKREICKEVDPDSVSITDGLALIAVVGRQMINNVGTAARVFLSIANAKINIRLIDQGLSENNIILGVAEEDFEVSIRRIYNEFTVR
ncbi:MAG: aspartate kinase [Clostridia bacterium]|nr:aspartate kinase [Clostridia bacterium]